MSTNLLLIFLLCAISGTFSQCSKTWSSWGACDCNSATTGGTRVRQRKYTSGCLDEREKCWLAATRNQRNCPSCTSTTWSSWSACSTTCGGGIQTRTRSITGSTAKCDSSTIDTKICADQPACECQDTPNWLDNTGASCPTYKSNYWCTTSGEIGPQAPFVSFAARARASDGTTAPMACCACGKNKCVADVVILIDRSGSIGADNFDLVKKYLRKRVNSTAFTGATGNRIGIVGFDDTVEQLCEMTHDKRTLLTCVDNIQYTGGSTFTASGIDLAGEQFDMQSSLTRIRVMEVLTDGDPNDGSTDTAVVAQAIKRAQTAATTQKAKGVVLMAIGLGSDLNPTVLRSFASEPKDTYSITLSQFTTLDLLASLLSSQCTPTLTDSTIAELRGISMSPATSLSPNPSQSPRPAASTSPGASQSPAASRSPATSASPVASQSPWPSSSPTPEPEVCATVEANVSQRYIRTFSGDGPRCTIDEVFGQMAVQYDCSRPSRACSYLICNKPLPEDIKLRLGRGECPLN